MRGEKGISTPILVTMITVVILIAGASYFLLSKRELKPAEFTVASLNVSPAEAQPGETVTVSLEVTNTGEQEGTYTVELKIAGAVENSITVTLAGGASTTITFEVIKEVAGSYSVAVNGLSGSFTVREVVILLENDFAPPSGKVSGPGEYGPWNTRLMIATSNDGLTWTRTNRILSDQADVPDAISDARGWIFVYYVTWAEAVRNRIVVAVSPDNGVSWSYKRVNIANVPEGWAPQVDPDVMLLDNGNFRLYFTSDPDGAGPTKPRTYSAISSDGLNFTLEGGVRFAVEEQEVLDPTLLKVDEVWHYFAGGVGEGVNYHATSVDGLNFTRTSDVQIDRLMFANGIAVPGGYRFYCFDVESPPTHSIWSIFSTDGETWEVERKILDVNVATGFESVFVRDPAVLRILDGTYMMFYTTRIP
jgi:hypothetical protein